MTIRITRNAAGNCITFIGSSMPAYFNACLSGQVDPNNPDLVSVVNDIQTANDLTESFAMNSSAFPTPSGLTVTATLLLQAKKSLITLLPKVMSWVSPTLAPI